MKDDLIRLLLALDLRQKAQVNIRGDTGSAIHILFGLVELITISELITFIHGTHPTKWGSKKWGFITWG